MTLCLLALRNTCCGNACFGEQAGWGASEFKVRYSEQVTLQFLRGSSWAGVAYLRNTVPMSPKMDERAVHCCAGSCFTGSCHVCVWKRLSRSISLAVYCLSLLKFVGVWSKHRWVFLERLRQSSKKFWKMFSNFRVTFGQVLKDLTDIFGKSSNMPSSACLYNKKNITYLLTTV